MSGFSARISGSTRANSASCGLDNRERADTSDGARSHSAMGP